jgi:hypothetical protein
VNALTPQTQAVVEQVGNADDVDVICENGRIVLTPVHPGAASAVRSRLAELGIREADVADAVRWAREERNLAAPSGGV